LRSYVSERQAAVLRRVFEEGKPLYVEDATAFPGRTLWLDNRLVPIRGEDGTVEHVLGVSRDATQRKKHEEALRYRIAYEGVVATASRRLVDVEPAEVPAAVEAVLALVTEFAEADRGFVYLLAPDGVTVAEAHEWPSRPERPHGARFVGASALSLPFVASHARRLESLRIASVAALGPEASAEKRSLEAAGVRSTIVVPLACAGALVGVIGCSMLEREREWSDDVDALLRLVGEVLASAVVRSRAREAVERMETELLKVQKLESIGILAGGIAHDFNNILTAIWGNVSLARACAGEDVRVRDRLADAEAALQRARELTRQLLAFSKGGAPVRKVVRLDQLVRDAAAFGTREPSVSLQVDLPGDLWRVLADETQITQVVQNLALNAAEAMPDGGTLSVRADNVAVGPDSVLPLAPGRYVRIGVADEGVGIPAENLPKIFVPYFTTKTHGSGLGLATSFAIVRRHGGHITIDTALARGTTLSVYLPAVLDAPEPIAPREMLALRGSGRVLVLDDDASVRESLVGMLRHLGYQAASARDGAEAIGLCARARERAEPFDAVIMDLTIRGGTSGKDTIRRLLEIEPNLAVVVSSGYASDPIMSDYASHGFRGVMMKPYDLNELGRALHRLLAREPSGELPGAVPSEPRSHSNG
jgi:signal transduction histidine kinase/ActR/RegA family two-component response regulator